MLALSLHALVAVVAAISPAQDPQETPASAPASSRPARVAYEPVGAVEVADFSETLHDAKRDKDLPILVLAPKGEAKHPVLVFSHGAGGSGITGRDLARAWAERGYVVIQPTHADSLALRRARGEEASMLDALGDAVGPDNSAGLERVRDVSFVLDSLDEIERRRPELRGRLDRERIGVGGHSFGAFTTQVIGGARVERPGREGLASFADPRVKAALVLSGMGSGTQGLTEDSWGSIRVPMMAMTGSKDGGQGGRLPQWRREAFDRAAPGDKYFVWFEGANHASFAGRRGSRARTGDDAEPESRPATAVESAPASRPGALRDRFRSQVRERLREQLAPDAPAAQPAIFEGIAEASLAFLDAYVAGRAEAKAWLATDGLTRPRGVEITLTRR